MTIKTLRALLEKASPTPWDSVDPNDPVWVDMSYGDNNELVCELVNAAPTLLDALEAAQEFAHLLEFGRMTPQHLAQVAFDDMKAAIGNLEGEL